MINSLRRIILTDIPTVIFKTFPHKENEAEFDVNTTRLNNEILKQRLGCIPIHIKDLTTSLENYIVEISKKNETKSIQYITTGDFQIKDSKSGKYVNESGRDKIFPRNKKTNDYILFARLRPKISDHIPGEELKITAKMSIGCAKDSGMYNVVSTCSYQMSPDLQKQRDAWEEEENELEKKGVIRKEIDIQKSNWFNHTAKRFYKPNTFDFILETIGVFTNREVLSKACDIIMERLDIHEFPIKEALSTMKNCYDFTLYNEDYTIGKVIEYILNNDYYYGKKSLSYVGFRKKHPHDTYSTIRIAFKLATNKQTVIQILKDVCKKGISIFVNIKSQIK